MPVWPFIVAAVIVLGFVGVVLGSLFLPHSIVGTDDARVDLHFVSVAPRVAGQVVEVAVNDNQPVHTGQLLVRLDERDYQTAVQRAEASLQRDEAQVANTAAQIRRQPALIAQAEAGVPAAQARLELAEQNTRRYRNLAATGAGTQQERQQAESSLRQAQADLVGAQAQTLSAEQQLAILEADRASAQATVREDGAQLAQARLNLSYTRIAAPLDGLVGQRTVQVGDYIAPGGALMTVLPLDAAYIEANYREVALRHVRPGQHVRIHLDAYDIDLDGVVDSLAPATGATFAAVAPGERHRQLHQDRAAPGGEDRRPPAPAAMRACSGLACRWRPTSTPTWPMSPRRNASIRRRSGEGAGSPIRPASSLPLRSGGRGSGNAW